MTESSIGVYILYGSQNGQAQSIAEGLHEDAIFEGMDCKVFCLKDEGKMFDIKKIKLAIFICSTTGDGDPPENARSFIDKLNNLPADDDDNHLNKLHFALLGLGNSDYSTFCGGPKKLLSSLTRLHATQYYLPTIFADDATDGDDVTDEWIDNLWDHVKKEKKEIENIQAASLLAEEMKTKMQMSDNNKELPTTTTLSSYPDKSLFRNTDLKDVNLNLPPLLSTYIQLQPTSSDCCHSCDDDVITATVTSSKRLTSEDSDKVTMELELQVDDEVDYQPGDSFEFQCPNSQQEVEFLMSRLQPRPDADESSPQTIKIVAGFEGKPPPRHLPSTLPSITHTLTWLSDIRAVCKKSLIRALADVTSHEDEARRLLELCSRQGGSDYTKHIRLPQLNIIDILHNFPSCHPNVELIIQHLPPLRHRPYSVATSPKTNPKILKFAYTVVHTAKGDTNRRADRTGLATGYLQNLTPETQLKIKHRCSTFRLPTDPTVPVIMIGPGTGVAPFIGFIEHGVLEEAHLYFGCRRPDEDFIYEKQLKEFKSCGALTSMNVAFSRIEEDGSGKYVQDLLRADGQLVVDVLCSRNGVVYVCGDARGMSRDVRSCFVQIFVHVKGCTEEEGKLLLKQLVDEKRYKEDVWA